VPQVVPIADQLAALETGRTTSRELVEKSLAAAVDPAGQGVRTFTKVYSDSALYAADSIDQQRRTGEGQGALLGLPISV